ncbi:MAG: hypothetical protein E7599_06510 [Ruminococcaceae bacterium]|nr:hypothetical protein [Oscillospiraceae bacterium]
MALISAFGAISCGSEKNTAVDTLENQDLVVVQTPVRYSRLEMIYLANRMEDIYARGAAILNKKALTDNERLSVNQYIKENILPMLQSVGVTKDELIQLLYFTDFLLTTAERGSILVAQKLFEETYRNYVQVLGSERAGQILYHSCLLYLDSEIEKAESNYAQTNNPSLLQELELLTTQKRQLAKVLGEKAFADVATVFYFTTSLFTHPNGKSGEEGSPTVPELTNEELLLLWQRQAEHLEALALSNEQWQIAGDFFFAFLFRFERSPFEKNSLRDALWQALAKKDEAESIGIGKALPSLINLYAAAIKAMTPSQIARLRNGDATEKSQCLMALFLSCPNEFMTFLDTFSKNVHLQSRSEQQMLVEKGLWEDYLAYSSKRTPITPTQLYQCLSDCVSAGEGLPFDAIESYLYANLPYTTFVFFHERSSQS